MTAPTEVTIEGHQFRIGRLSALQQLHCVRRLGPVAPAFVRAFLMMQAAGVDFSDDSKPLSLDTLLVFEPALQTLAGMADDDVNYVVAECNSVVALKQGETAWAPLQAPGGSSMFPDLITLPVQLQLVWRVLETNLGNFIGGLQSALRGQPGMPPNTNRPS